MSGFDFLEAIKGAYSAKHYTYLFDDESIDDYKFSGLSFESIKLYKEEE